MHNSCSQGLGGLIKGRPQIPEGAELVRKDSATVNSQSFKDFIRSLGQSFRKGEWKYKMETWELPDGTTSERIIGRMATIVITTSRRIIITYFLNILLSKLHDYNSEKISRDDLSMWALNWQHNLLAKRDLMFINKFAIYPFIIMLAINKESWEFLSDDKIKEYIEILEGNKNFKYSCYMKIPQEVNRKPIESIIELINSYKTIGHMTNRHLESIYRLQEEIIDIEISTIADMLFFDIVQMLSELPRSKSNEVFNVNTVFVSDDIKVDDIINRLSRINECYKGNREFKVNIAFQKGNYILNILI